MRTLPLRLSPVDGESLLGYITRYSHTFQFQPGDVISALGLDPGAGGLAAAARYGVSLSAEQLQHATFATGITSDVLEGMLLSRDAGSAFGRSAIAAPVALTDAVQGQQMWIWCSRFCPPCLREDGTWQLRWQLGCSALCARHQILLRLRCPQCRRVPQVGARRRWQQDHRGLLTDPSRCWRRHRHALCRANLAEADTVSVAGDTQLLAAQRRIDALLDGQPQHRIGN
jgi:TniQ